jgi:hypothetical protein
MHCFRYLHYGWAWNLASKMDDTGAEATPTALGYVFFSGFRPEQTMRGIFGDPSARVITLKRRSKKRLVVFAVCVCRARRLKRRAWELIWPDRVMLGSEGEEHARGQQQESESKATRRKRGRNVSLQSRQHVGQNGRRQQRKFRTATDP